VKVIVVGSGGREHVLCWKIRQSPLVQGVYCAPGNAGIAGVATCVPTHAEDVPAIADLVRAQGIDLTVVGGEAPLALGLADRLREEGRLVVGPGAAAAEIESSKAFAKELMARHDIPTACYAAFDDARAAYEYLETHAGPVVVKADGLAAGKGVTLCSTEAEAKSAVRRALEERAFGAAGGRVIIEAMLRGEEGSYIVLTDGERFIPLTTAKDHKAVFDGNRGPNTGGMGVVSPAPALDEAVQAAADRDVVGPVLRGLASEGRRFQGFLYAGLMVDGGRPQVLEFNARLGDPEAQGILVRLESDLVPALVAVAEGDLRGIELRWDSRPSITVVLTSRGYPGEYATGLPISGLVEASAVPEVQVFHSGTRISDGRLVTAGGRVLAVTARGATRAEAAERAYAAAAHIRFEGAHYRRDIGSAPP
jgi:phosphoribosylamine--glycine ligase